MYVYGGAYTYIYAKRSHCPRAIAEISSKHRFFVPCSRSLSFFSSSRLLFRKRGTQRVTCEDARVLPSPTTIRGSCTVKTWRRFTDRRSAVPSSTPRARTPDSKRLGSPELLFFPPRGSSPPPHVLPNLKLVADWSCHGGIRGCSDLCMVALWLSFAGCCICCLPPILLVVVLVSSEFFCFLRFPKGAFRRLGRFGKTRPGPD